MIEQLVLVGLSNAVVATVLALMVVAITRVWRQAPLAHLLWLIVLVKLVTPPLVDLPITIPVANQSVTAGSDDLGKTQFGSETEAVLTFDPSGRLKNVESARGAFPNCGLKNPANCSVKQRDYDRFHFCRSSIGAPIANRGRLGCV